MKSKLLVSIIINNYNYDRFLAEAIDNALDHTYANTEVVVNDGSTAHSLDITQRYKDRIVAVFKDDGEQALAINAAFAASKDQIIYLRDAKDTFFSNKVDEFVKLFESQLNIYWVFTESAQIEPKDLVDMDVRATIQNILNNKSEDL